MVKTQVESQIKVRDLSNLAVSIAPADFGSWHDARYRMLHLNHTLHHCANSHTDAHVDSTELMSEAKSGLKARVEAELAAAADEDELKTLRDRFSAEERALEHQIGLLPKHPLNPHNPLRGHTHPRFFTQITRSTPSPRRSLWSTMHAQQIQTSHATACAFVSIPIG